ncbi:MAG: acyl-CoA thioesterase [Fimbriimonadaceae bacterium]|nr:acyl-CoA thioesterase [Fimbriimonadaceae bacterium]
MEARRVSETKLVMAQRMTPNDANYLGKVFGGSILALIDLTAASVSSRFAREACVTASFDRVDFLQPVEIGDLVELEGFVSFVGRTSMEVIVDVHATNLIQDDRRHVNTARVTMVAMRDGRTVPVPRLICETRDEKLRFLEGRLRREVRQQRLQENEAHRNMLAAAKDEDLDRLLAHEGSVRELLSSISAAGG